MVRSSVPLAFVFWFSLLFGLSVFLLGKNHAFKRWFVAAGILAVDVFFSVYIYTFFVDLVRYYVATLASLAHLGQLFLLLYFVMFLAITLCFYAGGFVVFLLETKKEFRSIR